MSRVHMRTERERERERRAGERLAEKERGIFDQIFNYTHACSQAECSKSFRPTPLLLLLLFSIRSSLSALDPSGTAATSCFCCYSSSLLSSAAPAAAAASVSLFSRFLLMPVACQARIVPPVHSLVSLSLSLSFSAGYIKSVSAAAAAALEESRPTEGDGDRRALLVSS